MRYYRPMMMSPTPSTSALVVLRRYHVVCRPIFEWRSGYTKISMTKIESFEPHPTSTSCVTVGRVLLMRCGTMLGRNEGRT